MRRWTKGMRDVFFKSLYNLAKKDSNVILLTADTGAICHDEFRKKLKKQYINVGIAEQNMIGVAAGLALSGKIVYVYGITPFVTARCYEQIRVDLGCMDLPVTVVGIGAGFDYSTLGPTHHGTEDFALMRVIPKMKIYAPCDSLMAEIFVGLSYKEKGPKYIRLDRTGIPLVYKNKKDVDVSKGFTPLVKGRDLYIVSTGRSVYTALQAAKGLSRCSISAGVIDLFRIKPLNEETLWPVLKKVRYVATLEEHFLVGGIGEIVGRMLLNKQNTPAFKSFGIRNEFCREYGSREHLHWINMLDAESVARSIKEWVGVA